MFLAGLHPLGRHAPSARPHIELLPDRAEHFPGAGGGEQRKFQGSGCVSGLLAQRLDECRNLGERQRRVWPSLRPRGVSLTLLRTMRTGFALHRPKKAASSKTLSSRWRILSEDSGMRLRSAASTSKSSTGVIRLMGLFQVAAGTLFSRLAIHCFECLYEKRGSMTRS